MSIEGVDVSSWQGYINWGAVKNSGRSFAMLKATEGVGYRDPTFYHNWISTAYRGMSRIAYHYLRPSFDGVAQANFFHETVRLDGRFRLGDGVMLDLEETDGEPWQRVLYCAEQFVSHILDTTQAGVFLYTGEWFWSGILGSPDSATLKRCPLALASYGPSYRTLEQWPSGPAIWQYTANGAVPGVSGVVDLDHFLGNKDELHTLCREGGRH